MLLIPEVRLTPLRLQEHPGHPDQKVHGRRGSRATSGAADLMGPIENLRHLNTGSLNPCYSGTINGQQVFFKAPGNSDEVRKEVGAFLLNEAGGGLVRMLPTAARDIGVGGPAIAQPFSDGERIGDTDWRSFIGTDDANDIAVFDFITSNADRHLGNVMVDADNRLVAVDHGLAFGNGMRFRDYLYPKRDIDLTARQADFCQRIANMDPAELASKTGLTDDEVGDVQERAHFVFGLYTVPTPDNWNDMLQGGGNRVVHSGLTRSPSNGSSSWWLSTPTTSPPPTSTWRGKSPKFGTRAFRSKPARDEAQHQMRKVAGLSRSSRKSTSLRIVTPREPTAPGQEELWPVQPPWSEARVEEHGSHDQRTHGRRGATAGSDGDPQEWMYRDTEVTETNLNSGVNPSAFGVTSTGRPLFLKGTDPEETFAERVCARLNGLGGGLLPMPGVVYRQRDSLLDGGGGGARFLSEVDQLGCDVLAFEMVDGEAACYVNQQPSREFVADLDVFDFVVQNGDRHSGNVMFDRANRRFVAVDHGYSLGGARATQNAWTPTGVVRPLTEKQTRWLRAVVSDAGSVAEYFGGTPDQVAEVVRRAGKVLDLGHAPDWMEMEWLSDPLAEARLEEHPGHADQKVHGRRGVYSYDPHVDLVTGKITGIKALPRATLNPCYTGEIDGHPIFLKSTNETAAEDGEHEIVASNLNIFGGDLVKMPEVVIRHGHEMTPTLSGDKVVMPFIPGRAIEANEIESARMEPYTTPRGIRVEPPPGRAEQLDDIAVFDFVTSNGDRHRGNVWVTETGDWLVIDQGLAFEGKHSDYHRPYCYPKTGSGRPLTDRQHTFLKRIANAEISHLRDIGLKEKDAWGEDWADAVRHRARYILSVGVVPEPQHWSDISHTYSEIVPGYGKSDTPPDWKIVEAALSEHGSHDQQSHGRRGGSSSPSAGNPRLTDDQLANGAIFTAARLDTQSLNPCFIVEMQPPDGRDPMTLGPRETFLAFAKQPRDEDEVRCEIAAKRLNELGGGLVEMPQTVERTGDKGAFPNSSKPVLMQEFLDGRNATDWLYAQGPRGRGALEARPELDDIAVFDFVTGNRDRHEGNVWITDDDRVLAVDQGFSFERPSYCHDPFYPKPWDPPTMLSSKQRGWLRMVEATVESSSSRLGLTEAEARDVAIRARYALRAGRVPHREDWIEVARDYPSPVIRIVTKSSTSGPEVRPSNLGVTVPGALQGTSWLASDSDTVNSGFHDPNIRIVIGEARLEEHPGHAPQSVHGHRGSGPMPDWRRGRGTRYRRRPNPKPLDPIYDAYKVTVVPEEGRWDTVDGVDPYGSGHPVVRDKGAWGSSHHESRAIAGEAAHMMGLSGWDRSGEGHRGYVSRARLFLGAIGRDRLGAEEVLYHGTSNPRGIQFKPGDTMDLPLTACAGSPDTVSYGIRGWGPPKTQRAEAARHGVKYKPDNPTLFVFPKGTPMVSYSKWGKGDAREFGYVHSEALTAGRFRVKSVTEGTRGVASAWWNPKVTVVELEPVETFDLQTGSWRPTETKLLGSEPWRPKRG
jgi:hypothetical protein